MTDEEKEKAKQEKINAIILAPFKATFDFQDDKVTLVWSVEHGFIELNFYHSIFAFLDKNLITTFAIDIPLDFQFGNFQAEERMKAIISKRIEQVKKYASEKVETITQFLING